jgi:hypothetical protein
MNHRTNHIIDYKKRGYTIKISETNKILQKYRNSALTYDLIRKIVFDMNENARSTMIMHMRMDNNDIRMIYE